MTFFFYFGRREEIVKGLVFGEDEMGKKKKENRENERIFFFIHSKHAIGIYYSS